MTEKQIKKGEQLAKRFEGLMLKGVIVANTFEFWDAIIVDPNRFLKGFIDTEGLRSYVYYDGFDDILVSSDALAGFNFSALQEIMKSVNDFVTYLNYLTWLLYKDLLHNYRYHHTGFELFDIFRTDGLFLRLKLSYK